MGRPGKFLLRIPAVAAVLGLVSPGLAARAETLRIDPFARDRIVFDVGAAFGRSEATVAVAGDAAPGAEVEIRRVEADGGEDGATGPWRAAGTADADGRWRGQVALPGDDRWYRIEARAGEEDARATSRNQIGGGDVVGFFGQSELARLTSRRFDAVPAPAVAPGGQVQITLGAKGRTPARRVMVDDAADLSPAVKAMAAFWIANAPPGRKLHLVDLAESGTAHTDLADDGRPKRSWADLAATVASVRAAGTDLGLVLETWFAADRGVGQAWDRAFLPFYTGLTHRGVPAELGDRVVINKRSDYRLDHILWDLSGDGRGLFAEDVTALGIFGPHRFDTDTPRRGAIETMEGKPASGLRAIDRSRRGVETFLESDPIARIAVPMTLPVPLDYSNGVLRRGEWTDLSHPSGDTPDGLSRLGLHMMAAALVALRHADFAVPTFDKVRWTRDHVEVGSSAGPVVTARQVRGEAPPPRPDGGAAAVVRGFDLNGHAIERSELTADGMVRLYPPEGQRLAPRDVLEYGRGGANGFTADPAADWVAGRYLDLPIVDMGLVGLEGVAVAPATEPLPNTLRP